MDELIKLATSSRNARDHQKQIGPSQLGGCRRQFWLQVQGVEKTNDTLRLASWMGTAIHEELRRNVNYADPFGDRFETELAVGWVFDGVEVLGHVDVYDKLEKAVIDWKTTKLKNLRNFPSQRQVWQVQVYGLMLSLNGMPVDSVSLVGIARDGDERDVKTHTEAFDEGKAMEAIHWMRTVLAMGEDAPADESKRFCELYCGFYGGVCFGK